jgi:LacI family transcriptional regulator
VSTPPGTREPRAKRVTIVDVARHAGVSTAAASKVLRNAYGVSDGMRDRVTRSMEELGYRPHRPARGMRGRTFTVGMVVSDIENPFVNLLADGVKSVLSQQGYELLIAPGGYESRGQIEAMDALIDHQMDGLLLVAPNAGIDDLVRVARSVPLAVVGLHDKNDAWDTVASDDAHGARLVVDHLVALGHRRICFIANSTVLDDERRPEFVRAAGFIRAMGGHGLAADATILRSPWSMDGGVAAAHAVAEMSVQPTAVHAGADIVAFGILSAWWQKGLRVPQDFSLAGHDNSRTSAIGPISLTTVDQSGLEMGARAAALLLERIAGRPHAVHEVLRPFMVERTSTSEPRR